MSIICPPEGPLDTSINWMLGIIAGTKQCFSFRLFFPRDFNGIIMEDTEAEAAA